MFRCRIGFTNLWHITRSSYPSNPELPNLPGFVSLPLYCSDTILHFRFPSAQAINLLNLVDEGENSFSIISCHIAPALQVGRVFYDLGSNLRGKNWEQQFFYLCWWPCLLKNFKYTRWVVVVLHLSVIPAKGTKKVCDSTRVSESHKRELEYLKLTRRDWL